MKLRHLLVAVGVTALVALSACEQSTTNPGGGGNPYGAGGAPGGAAGGPGAGASSSSGGMGGGSMSSGASSSPMR